MIVKFMSDEDMADACNAKQFRLFSDVRNIDFTRNDDGEPLAWLTFRDGSMQTVGPQGNTYVMDDTGKTIETFAHSVASGKATA
jgi:hypothetical protein